MQENCVMYCCALPLFICDVQNHHQRPVESGLHEWKKKQRCNEKVQLGIRFTWHQGTFIRLGVGESTSSSLIWLLIHTHLSYLLDADVCWAAEEQRCIGWLLVGKLWDKNNKLLKQGRAKVLFQDSFETSFNFKPNGNGFTGLWLQ